MATLRTVMARGDEGQGVPPGRRLTMQEELHQRRQADECINFYQDRIHHFETERMIFDEYEKLIVPKKTELHMLDWENRRESEVASSKANEIREFGNELLRLNADLADAKSRLDNMRESQKSRQEQIRRLSCLTYPMQQDTTYLFKERYPVKLTAKAVADLGQSVPANPLTAKQLKSGEILILERRLSDETKNFHDSIGRFEIKAREAYDTITAKVHHSEDVFLPTKRAAEELALQLDQQDRQCYRAVQELLNLRLRIMTSQREEVDELERLKRDSEYYEQKERQMKESLLLEASLMKKRIETETISSTKELKFQITSLDHQLEVLKKKEAKCLEKAKLQEERDRKLSRMAEQSKIRYIRFMSLI
jgi:hypothetical protein